MINITVSDIMTRYPVTAKPETNLLECAKKMVKKRVGSLLLTVNKKLVGFISQEDILWALVKKSKKDLKDIKAIDISPRKIATIRPEASIQETLRKMKKLKFERLPVIKQKELVGVITIKDIVNFNPKIYPELKEFEQIREETDKLKRIRKTNERNPIHEGICEECGREQFLYRIDGRLICEFCRDTM